MTFLWPHLLWLLLLLPLLVGAYVLLLRRRKKLMLRYASLGLVKQAMGGSQSWKRHLPPALFFLAIAAALLAASASVWRPRASGPSGRAGRGWCQPTPISRRGNRRTRASNCRRKGPGRWCGTPGRTWRRSPWPWRRWPG